MQRLELQLQGSKEEEERLRSRLAETEAELQQQRQEVGQAQAQLAQMVEAQRRLGQELQEGVEAREDAEAARDQAQVLTSFKFCLNLHSWEIGEMCCHGYQASKHWRSRGCLHFLPFWSVLHPELRGEMCCYGNQASKSSGRTDACTSGTVPSSLSICPGAKGPCHPQPTAKACC